MSAPTAKSMRVLVVVADSGLQKSFELVLAEAGYEPHVVATLAEALARMDETSFSLILADLFDDTSPLTLTPVHVLQSGGEPIPIGLLTTSPRSAEEARAAGFAFVVPMPFNRTTFLAQIAAALDRPRANELQRHQEARSAVHTFVLADDPPTMIALDDRLLETIMDTRTLAAEMRTWARESAAQVRNVQAEVWHVRQQAAAACRDAWLARARAEEMSAAVQEAWIRTEEVRALAEAAGARIHALWN